MKKLLIASVFSFVIAFNATAFDQERFDSDTAYYNEHKDDAKAIITLLSVFNTNKGVREAFEQHANGNATKWQTILNKMKKADEYAKKIDTYSYFGSCSSAVNYAQSMWLSAPKGRKIAEWNDKNSFDLQAFNQSKLEFQKNYSVCKNSVNHAPDKKDYENELIILGSEK
ncbi:hypothetical protein [Avibacterium paragallinarum]|uniref:hypothetical protein n=1 Tax=Avibacterium paragallinarum TaxID=728 RepID=UPI00397ADE63